MDFDQLYRLWYRRMVLFAGTFAGLSAEETEDLAHDAIVHAWFHLDRFDPVKPFAPWLYRVARNFILDYLRRRPQTVPLESAAVNDEETRICASRFSEPVSDGPGPEDLAIASDLAARVDRLIARLDGKDRRVALLVMKEGINAREAGAVLGMPAGTVRWRVSRIRSKVRALLEEPMKEEL